MMGRPKKTPIRSALKKSSALQKEVQDGIGAVERSHRNCLAVEIRASFGDSLDLDKALVKGHEQENRWDYLLGHTQSGEVIGLEPHTARQDQIRTVIRKKNATMQQLACHLKSGVRITAWLWVASGRVQFAATEKARRRLDQQGIRFVDRKVQSKHLPATVFKSKKTSHGR
ncbi:MAG: hypothetical protein ABI333_30835 [bacterium]